MNFHSRRQGAVLTAIAFVIATVAIPALHLAFHSLPHDHAGGEIHYHVVPTATHHDTNHHQAGDRTPSHRHGDHGTAHDHHSQPSDPQPFDPEHGKGSFAHFSLAVSDAPAATVVLLLWGAAPVADVVSLISTPPSKEHISVRRFRGPPRG